MSIRLVYSVVFALSFCVQAKAQIHKSSVNLFKQQTKAIQKALPIDCSELISGDSTNAFTQNINHPCFNPGKKKVDP